MWNSHGNVITQHKTCIYFWLPFSVHNSPVGHPWCHAFLVMFMFPFIQCSVSQTEKGVFYFYFDWIPFRNLQNYLTIITHTFSLFKKFFTLDVLISGDFYFLMPNLYYIQINGALLSHTISDQSNSIRATLNLCIYSTLDICCTQNLWQMERPIGCLTLRNTTSHVPIRCMSVQNRSIAWSPILPGTRHLSNTTAKCEFDGINSCGENQRSLWYIQRLLYNYS